MVTAFANGRLSRSEAGTWRLLPASARQYSRTFWPGPSPLPGAVLYGRAAGPSLESPHQGCRLRISQQVGDLLQAQVGVGQVVLGQIAAYVIDELAVTRAAFAEPSLQRLAAHVGVAGHVVERYRALGQPLYDV